MLTAQDTRGVVRLSTSEPVKYLETVRVVGRFFRNDDSDWGVQSRAQGICGRIRAVRITQRDAKGGFQGALGALRNHVVAGINPLQEEGRALMAEVITADRSGLKQWEADDAFAAAGLSHLIAVSGSHLVVVGAGLEALLIAFHMSPKMRTAGVVIVTGLYVMVCASPTSAVRSWVMMGVSKLGRSVGRRAHAPSGMVLTGIALCLGNPTYACDLGFLFSTLSVCALALFSRHAEAVLSRLGPRSKLFKRARRWCYRHTSGELVFAKCCSYNACNVCRNPRVSNSNVAPQRCNV